MKDNKLWDGRTTQHGSALVEFAITFPLLVLMTMGAVDFGRVFFQAVTVTSAASAGAFYGAQDNVKTGDISGMRAYASNDASDLTEISTTAERFCDCPDDPGVEVNCITATCSGYGLPRLFVRTGVRKTFQTLGPYPGIPNSVSLNRNAFLRVQ